MEWNFKRELARKFVHFLSIFILIIYFFVSNLFNTRVALIFLVLLLIIFLELEYFRLELKNKIPLLNKIWNYLRRDNEKEKIGGDIFFLIGSILVLAVFDLRIAFAGILMTTFGDLSAALIGTKFGKHYLKNFKDRAWEGIFAEFFVNIFIGIIVFFFIFEMPFYFSTWLVIIVMALTATVVETVVSKMDDNLLIPIFSCFNGQVVLYLIEFLNKKIF